MTASHIKYGDLAEFLTGLGFVSMAVGEAGEHTGTLILIRSYSWQTTTQTCQPDSWTWSQYADNS